MTDVIVLSRLLNEATNLQRLVTKIEDDGRSSGTPMTWQRYEQRYRAWYDESVPLLPREFQTPFVRGYTEGAWQQPAIQDVLAEMLAQETGSAPNVVRNTHKPMRLFTAQHALREILEYQRNQLFYARRRAWGGVSALPKGMAVALARICKQTFQMTSIEELFIRSGCEPHWHIPPFQPDLDSERSNEALSWLDGIMLYAPEQEVAIVQVVCENILARPNLNAESRAEIVDWLAQLQQPVPVSVANPLDPYPIHPTVRRIAGPRLASGHHSDAILQVCIALNQAVREAVGRPELDGSKLMQQAFSPNNPLLRMAQDDTEQQGWMHLYTGLIMALRNPRAHRHVDDTDEAATIEWLMFASALFRALDAAGAAASSGSPSSSP